MDKFEYENAIYNIKKYERKLIKIEFENDFLDLKKPSIIEYKKRKSWKQKKMNLLKEKEEISKSLLIAYANLEKIF